MVATSASDATASIIAPPLHVRAHERARYPFAVGLALAFRITRTKRSNARAGHATATRQPARTARALAGTALRHRTATGRFPDMPIDPVAQFHRWYARAQGTSLRLPNAMALATADRRGAPSVRVVLLKQADTRGFVFFTDRHSHKGRDLTRNPRAALAFHWEPIGRQVRVEGRVEPVSVAESNAYWETRPRASRLAACASRQSARLGGREALLARWRRLRDRYRGRPIPRPPAWSGFRVVPDAIEFWTHRAHRLHERERFVRTRGGWRRTLLQP